MKPIAASIAASLFVVGCGPSFPTVDSAALAEAIAQVRGHTVQICNYFPSDDSLIKILTTANPIVETAYNIAKQICVAVTATVPAVSPAQSAEPKLGEESQCPMVRGTCITGRFLDGAQLPPETAP